MRIWWRLGGKVYIQLWPLHVMLNVKGFIVHGTNANGFWHVDYGPWSAYLKWKRGGFRPAIRII